MIPIQHKLPDAPTDLVGAMVAKLQEVSRWTSEKKRRHSDLMRLLDRYGYVQICANYGAYHLNRIGQSCQYDVPETRRGTLKLFRGDRVRLVCVGHRGTSRVLMAGKVAG